MSSSSQGSPMAESAVKSAVQWLGKLTVEEVKYLYGVRDKVEELQAELEWIQCFLSDADARRHKDAVLRKWVAQIKDFAYEAEDVIDKYVLRVFNHYKHHSLFSWAALEWLFCLASDAVALYEIGSDIDSLTQKISKLSSRLQTYGVKTAYGETTSTSVQQYRMQELRRTYAHLGEDLVVGLEDDISNLSRVLINDNYHKMVAICGMGGLGKSTLARKVYRNSSVRKHFMGFAWAHVSQQFSTRSIILGILLELIPENDKDKRNTVQGLPDGQLHGELYMMLKEKSYLVVLDDVWTTEDWTCLQAAFPMIDDPNISSKVLLTTRNGNIVAGLRDLVLLHEPKLLDMEKSWELLQKRAFPVPTARNEQDQNLENFGKKMLQHCKGLPLAIVVLGGVLANKRTSEDWQNVLDNIRSYFGADKLYNQSYSRVYDVLGMSYYDLPYHLKSCFLHLGNFPEDFEVRTDKLYRMWIAEGIVTVDDVVMGGKTLEDVAESYLTELVEKRMVMTGRVTSKGKIKTCHLHDLIRDVSMALGKEENFVTVINHIHGESDFEPTPTLNERTRRLTIYVGKEGGKISLPSSLSGKAPNLRSLLFIKVHETKEEEDTELIKIICKEFELLRILELEDLSIRGDLPVKIGNLIYLKYLNLRGTQVTSLPSSISNLRCLETLDLRSRKVIKLPNLLWKLQKLKHLYFPFHIRLTYANLLLAYEIEKGYEIENGEMLRLDGLRFLETLEGVHIDRLEVTGLLGLRKMKRLSAICFNNKESLVPFLNSPSIKRLSLFISGSVLSQDLANCQSLHRLEVHNPITVPLRSEMFPQSLVYLVFLFTNLCQDPMPILEHRLPRLKTLQLLIAQGSSRMVCSAGGFPELKVLVLGLSRLREWRVEDGALPKLRSMKISHCFKLTRLPDGLPGNIDITCIPCVPGIEKYGTCPLFNASTNFF